MAEVATTTGWTWDYVEREICLHRHAALQRLWRRSPPLQAMVQAYLGIEGVAEPAPHLADQPPKEMSEAEYRDAVSAFARNFAAAGGTVH